MGDSDWKLLEEPETFSGKDDLGMLLLLFSFLLPCHF